MVEAGCTIPSAEESKNRKKEKDGNKKVPASPAQQQQQGAGKPPKPSKTGSTKSNNPNRSLASGGSLNAGKAIKLHAVFKAVVFTRLVDILDNY
jgi:hypothetical protein